MAARNLAPVRALVRDLVPIIGSFAPNGASAIVATSNKGLGFTVARISAGLYRLTFTDKFADLVSAQSTLQLAAAADLHVQVGTYTPASKTLDIRVVAVATETDVAANANNRINFVAWFRNSSALPTRG